MTDAPITHEDLAEIKEDLARLEGLVKEMADAWRAARMAVVFAKWLSSFVIAVGAAWAVLKSAWTPHG